MRTDSASLRFFRQRIASLRFGRASSDSASLRHVVRAPSSRGTRRLLFLSNLSKVTSTGNRQRPPYGGNYERRIDWTAQDRHTRFTVSSFKITSVVAAEAVAGKRSRVVHRRARSRWPYINMAGEGVQEPRKLGGGPGKDNSPPGHVSFDPFRHPMACVVSRNQTSLPAPFHSDS